MVFFANVEAIKLNYRIISLFSPVDLDKIYNHDLVQRIFNCHICMIEYIQVLEKL